MQQFTEEDYDGLSPEAQGDLWHSTLGKVDEPFILPWEIEEEPLVEGED
jgi:hypothetical protein